MGVTCSDDPYGKRHVTSLDLNLDFLKDYAPTAQRGRAESRGGIRVDVSDILGRLARLNHLKIVTGETTTVKVDLEVVLDATKLPVLQHIVMPNLGGGLQMLGKGTD